MTRVDPWLPPDQPDLALLAMAAADDAGLGSLRAWPEVRKGGIAFADLPPFLPWRGRQDGTWHLILVQPREVGALVPGARMAPLPPSWLAELDLEALGRPLARHPDFPGGASVQVVQLPGPGTFRLRSHGASAPGLVAEVLARISAIPQWVVVD